MWQTCKTFSNCIFANVNKTSNTVGAFFSSRKKLNIKESVRYLRNMCGKNGSSMWIKQHKLKCKTKRKKSWEQIKKGTTAPRNSF